MDTLQTLGSAIIALALCNIAQVLAQRRGRRSSEAATRRTAIEAIGGARARGGIEAPIMFRRK